MSLQNLPGAPVPAGSAPIRLGLCGATGGGKTTFLGAMSTAVTSADRRTGQWSITPADQPSYAFLVQKEKELVSDRRFPAATQQATLYQWQIDGRLQSGGRRGGLFRRGAVEADVSFTIEVEDHPGGAFLMDSSEAVPITSASLDRLATANGLVFLFDPMRELNRQTGGNLSNWRYFHRVVQALRMLALHKGLLVKGLLPHHLAVCVTKFDDPHIFLPTYDHLMIDVGEDGIPRVPVARGREFFHWLCKEMEYLAPDFSALQLANLIASSFDETRVAYYSTSSIGFKEIRGGQLDRDDFQNYDIINGQPVIGRVRPVNVLEPLVDIERRVRNGAGR